MSVDSVLDLVGNTPVVKIKSLVGENDATVLAKLERFNPSGSVKDRVVKYIIEHAERTGVLAKGQTIVEATSGNTGISLAMICAIRGYKVKLVMPESASMERRKIMLSFGAELMLVEDEYEAIRIAERLARENNYFHLNQFGNPLNVDAHYQTTGAEIIEQTGGKIDAFVAGIGTGGTIVGVGRRLKEYRSEIEIIGVEPKLKTKIEGTLNFTDSGYKPPILDLNVINEVVRVKDEDALRVTRELAGTEGLFVGPSSGAAMYAALQKARELGKGKTVVVIFPDGGERYLSTESFE